MVVVLLLLLFFKLSSLATEVYRHLLYRITHHETFVSVILSPLCEVMHAKLFVDLVNSRAG